MAASRTQLYNWFKNGLKPVQSHFAALIDSFVHKDDIIAIDKIEGLNEAIQQVDGQAAVNNHASDEQLHGRAYDVNKSETLKFWVERDEDGHRRDDLTDEQLADDLLLKIYLDDNPQNLVDQINNLIAQASYFKSNYLNIPEQYIDESEVFQDSTDPTVSEFTAYLTSSESSPKSIYWFGNTEVEPEWLFFVDEAKKVQTIKKPYEQYIKTGYIDKVERNANDWAGSNYQWWTVAIGNKGQCRLQLASYTEHYVDIFLQGNRNQENHYSLLVQHSNRTSYGYNITGVRVKTINGNTAVLQVKLNLRRMFTAAILPTLNRGNSWELVDIIPDNEAPLGISSTDWANYVVDAELTLDRGDEIVTTKTIHQQAGQTKSEYWHSGSFDPTTKEDKEYPSADGQVKVYNQDGSTSWVPVSQLQNNV